MNEFVATLVPAIGTALVRFTWQGLAIGLAAAFALQLARNAKPQARYAIAGLALLACALVPLAGVLAHLAADSPTGPALAAGTPGEAVGVAAVRFVGGASQLETLLPLIVALWAAGASVFCLRTLGGLAWIARLRGSPQPPLQATWQARLDTLALRFGLRGVALKLVDAIDSPVVAGWWRPVVLLPTAVVLRMPADAVEALLAHELAHVKRMDYLVNLVQRVVEALLFFHPVVWWLSRRVRIERELVADRLAADAIGDARRLARALAALSDLQATPRAHPHLAQAAHGGHLMSRIQQLLQRSPSQRLPAGRVALPLIGVAAACIAFYAQAQIGRDAKPTAEAAAAATTTATQAQAAADAASAERVAAGYAADTATSAATHARVAERTAQAEARRATETARNVDDNDRHAFALVHKGEDGYSMSGSSDDMDEIEAAKSSLQDDFLWFRRDGKAYVIDDPAMVARADAAWKDSHVLGKQMEGLGAQMEVHGKKMEAYGAQMEKLSEHHRPTDAMMAAQERVQALAEEQAALAGKQALLAMKQRRTDDDKAEMQLDREMDALGAQLDKLGDQLDAQTAILERESEALARNTAPMEALGRQMEEASKPMDVLGKQMGELGRQQEQLARRAMVETDRIIEEGLRNGKAKPAPTRR